MAKLYKDVYISKTIEVIEDVHCDFCDRSMVTSSDRVEVRGAYNVTEVSLGRYARFEIHSNTGYSSKLQYDGAQIGLEICEHCFDEIIKPHVNNPELVKHIWERNYGK